MADRFSLSDRLDGQGEVDPSPSPTSTSTSTSDRRPIWRPLLGFLVFEGALLLTVAGALYLDWAVRAAGLERAGAAWLEARAGNISRDLGAVASDMGVLFTDMTLRLPLSSPENTRQVQARLLTFAGRHREYGQVRLLDETGFERIRIDDSTGSVQPIRDRDLQDKGTRDYVVETRILPPGHVSVSRLDLNIENGEVQWPPNPQIRFSTRLPSPPDGPGGLLVLNGKGQLLIDPLEQTDGLNVDTAVWLLDGKGDYLHAPGEEKAWGFVLGRGQAFSNDRPEIWSRMLESAAFRPTMVTGRDQFLMFDPLDQARTNVSAWGGAVESRSETDRWVLMLNHPLEPWYVPKGGAILVVPILAVSGTILVLVAVRGWGQGRTVTLFQGAVRSPLEGSGAEPAEPRMAVCQWRLEADGTLHWVYVSPGMESLLGLRSGMTPPMEAEDVRRVSGILRQVTWDRGDVTIESRFVSTSGESRWWRAEGRMAFVDKDGNTLFNVILEPLSGPSRSPSAGRRGGGSPDPGPSRSG
jgi:hypothetical protein